MPLNPEITYFLAVKEAVFHSNPVAVRATAVNHLILGDSMTFLNETVDDWSKFHCRGTDGWLKTADVTHQGILEINFVDIGQGDGCHIVTPAGEIILVDAGEGVGLDSRQGDNMHRFLSWRYGLRKIKSPEIEEIGMDDPEAIEKLEIDYAIISHPDTDHYYGFLNIFKNPKIKIKNICHNGIFERSVPPSSNEPWLYDFGRITPTAANKKNYYLWDTVLTHNEAKEIIEAELESGKFYLKTLVGGYQNNPDVQFKFLAQNQGYLDHFNEANPLKLEILAPLTETVKHKTKTRQCLVKLGNEGVTKNGHSIVFQLRYGKLKMLLGGDLNSESQDYLAQFYSGISTKMSTLENEIRALNVSLAQKENLTASKIKSLEKSLSDKTKNLNLIIERTKTKFGSDVAKACHHGASDVLDSFLSAINPLATIISSGDNEPHSHPRPDALGAYGKSSRGPRPLLFSTELARSTNEFSYPFKFYSILKELEIRMNEMTKPSDKEIYRLRMEKLRDGNVARYGMITVRSDGEQVIIAQKLEQNRSNSDKWDIYSLSWNDKLNSYEYRY